MVKAARDCRRRSDERSAKYKDISHSRDRVGLTQRFRNIPPELWRELRSTDDKSTAHRFSCEARGISFRIPTDIVDPAFPSLDAGRKVEKKRQLSRRFQIFVVIFRDFFQP